MQMQGRDPMCGPLLQLDAPRRGRRRKTSVGVSLAIQSYAMPPIALCIAKSSPVCHPMHFATQSYAIGADAARKPVTCGALAPRRKILVAVTGITGSSPESKEAPHSSVGVHPLSHEQWPDIVDAA